MFGWLTIFCGVLWQLGAAAPAAAAERDLAGYQVTRPGEVLFERQLRAAWLAGLPAEQRVAWCGPARDEWRSHKAKTRLKTPSDDADESTDRRSAPFAWTVMTTAAAAFGRGDAEAREALIGNLRRWARGEALTKLQDRQDNTYYSLERTLLPTIVAYGLIRDDPTWDEGEHEEVEQLAEPAGAAARHQAARRHQGPDQPDEQPPLPERQRRYGVGRRARQ